MQSYRRTSFCPRTLKHWGMLRNSKRVLILQYSSRGVRLIGLEVENEWHRLPGLDSTLRYFMMGTLSQVMVAPSRVIISTAPCCTKKLLCKKYALLKKTKQPKSSSFLPVHQLPAHYYYYCCMACTYCQQCCDTSVHSTVVPPLLLYVYVPL